MKATFAVKELLPKASITVRVSHVGLDSDEMDNFMLKLGETRSLVFILIETGTTLSEITVSARIDYLTDAAFTRAATNLSRQTIERRPSAFKRVYMKACLRKQNLYQLTLRSCFTMSY